jgi:DNA-directed RNA polymerase subunit RPC12/RpoP
MPEVKAYKCDHCGKLIEDDREVYKIELKGRAWREGPPTSDCQNVIQLGFCSKCARRIVFALEEIAKREK